MTGTKNCAVTPILSLWRPTWPTGRQPGDVPATYADIRRAQEKLGFQPLTPIDVGIPRFIQWYFDYHRRSR
jgi:nucleoside-diphosphate-sugar epimerase